MLEVQDITFPIKKRESDIRTCKSFGRTGRTPWDSCTERLWQDHTVKDHQRLYQPGCGQNPCRRRAASTERLLSGTDDISASGTGSQSTTSHARGAKRRRWHLKRADRRTWDRRRLEKPFSAGTFRGRTSEILYCKSIGEGEQKYLLCDEITTMLDFITQGQIWNFLIEETKRRGIGMVIVSHSQPLLDHVCTRQIRLNENP